MFQKFYEKRRGNAEGFTLVELLVVIAILAILAAIVVVSIGSFGDKGKAVSCSADKSALVAAEEAYNASTSAGNGVYATYAQLVTKKFIVDSGGAKLHNVTLDTDGNYVIAGLNGCS